MKLQFLGTAAAEGIPSLFCRCNTCKNARARGGREIRTRSSALVNDRLLIDVPSDTFYHSVQFGIDLSELNQCLITHTHGDHTFPWEFFNLRRGRSTLPDDYEGFRLYGSEDITKRFADPLKESQGRLKIKEILPFEPFYIGDIKVTALKANHGTAHPYIYVIEDQTGALLYAHDTEWLPEETWAYLETAGVKFDIVSLDCTGGAAEEIAKYTHMYLGLNKKCRERLLSLGLADERTTFVLNHFSHNGLSVNYREFCEIVNPLGFEVSYDGMIVESTEGTI